MSVGVLKYLNSDFIVRESLVLPNACESEEQEYFLLKKSGYTTMEAIRLIAKAADVPSCDVTYAGLKDEDGITEQLVAIRKTTPPNDERKLNWDETSNRWMRLEHYGFGSDPLKIGRLQGNGFHITVRALEEAVAQSLSSQRKINFFYLNYYDIQRFGVPGGPKLTHTVGQSLLEKDWTTARNRLVELRAPESHLAAESELTDRDFFDSLDSRNVSFYLAAASSAKWNRNLAALVDSTASTTQQVEVEGVDFLYCTAPSCVVSVLAAKQTLPFERFNYDNGVVTANTSMRSTVNQTVISVGDYQADRHHAGRFQLDLNFFLPSGSYATSMIRQLLLMQFETIRSSIK